MKRNVKPFLAFCTPLIVGSMLFFTGCGQVKKTPLPFQATYAPIITEISPQTTDQESPWIELYNPLQQEVDASQLTLVLNDDHKFSLPDKLSKMPPLSHIIVRLDKKDKSADVYAFKEKSAPVLHPGPSFAEVLKPRAGQLAVYRKNDQGQDELVDFVAWGKPASQKSLTLERHKLWRKKWFVPQVNTFGDYDEKMLSQAKDFAIARYPGTKGQHISDWVVLYGDQRTPGAENLIPGVGMYTISDDATIRSEDIAFAWTSNKYAKKFKVQLAKDADFTQLVEDKEVTAAYFKPAAVLPEGKYYYRVKVIDRQGRESAWSKTRTLNSKKFRGAQGDGAGEDGAIIAEVVLAALQWQRQRKDSNLLCLDSCASHLDGATLKHWDNIHPDAPPAIGDHGHMNCVRASISMMAGFYGGNICQDRISYYTQEEAPGVGDTLPEWDLAHDDGMGFWSGEETDTLEWALNETITDFYDNVDPTFNELKGFLDANRPIMTRRPGHLRTMNGYREEDDGTQWVHILDPGSGPRWETYATWQGGAEPAEGVWVGPVSAPNVRSDEPEIWADSDNDGVMDFDEMIRFGTGRFDTDSDNDGVNDKEDIYEYVFQWGDVYAKRGADFDADGVRKEVDPDNDGDTFNDGCEDKNGNGIYEAASGETDNFAVDVGLVCGEKPIHAMMVFDRSGSMASPAADPKYGRAAAAATLFLDTWLVNNPPAQTKTGLVYYDHSAYFDTDATENTTLELLDAAKRDKIVASFATNQPNHGSTSIGGGMLKAMEAQGFNTAGIPAADQHRVMVVLTDGKENSGTRMDNPLVTQALVDGKVDGYVLGIGDETQIDEDKLNNLADILNHPPASLAKELDQFQLEKFFLQVLAETQGMEFNLDPVAEINPGQTKTHTVPVGPGAKRVTFVAVWQEKNAKLEFILKNPNGQTVPADVIKVHARYQVAAKADPAAGNWTMVVNASTTGTPAPATIHYSVMALEKNAGVASNFQILGGYYLTGNQLTLVANLCQDRKQAGDAKIQVEVRRPTVGWGTFAAQANVRIPAQPAVLEKDVVISEAEKKFQTMAARKLSVPTTVSTLTLNDEGKDG
ncbi:VWA domain-containing protein, partial [candidate division FCPU426 bacterium]|nr:VWA domain-containing protein [candidate division FCPU426 bacterium]